VGVALEAGAAGGGNEGGIITAWEPRVMGFDKSAIYPTTHLIVISIHG